MKLASVKIENFRAIRQLDLLLHERLTVLFGDNAQGKTSVLSAIAVGLGVIPTLLPDVTGINFKPTIDRRDGASPGVLMRAVNGIVWGRGKTFGRNPGLKQLLETILRPVWNDIHNEPPEELPIVAFYDTDRAALDVPRRRRNFRGEFPRYAALEGALSPRTNFRDFFQEDGDVLAQIPSAAILAIYGAKAGDVLASVMGVQERPPDNPFKKTLDAYVKLIGEGQGESPEALEYRRQLEALSPRDPALDRADIEIRRDQVLKRMKSTR